MTYDADAHMISSLAQKASMSAGWAWFVVEEKVPVSGMAGWLFFRTFLASEAMQVFVKEVSDYTKSHFNVTVSPESVDITFSAALHDAIMLYAHAATNVLAEGGDLHDGETVTKAVRSTRFEGVGNIMVALDQHGDRIDHYEVMNYVAGADGAVESVPVGLLNSTMQEYMAYERAVVWPGITVKVPVDYFSGQPRCMDPHFSSSRL